jgi:alkylhydroperoxidase family enzyme
MPRISFSNVGNTPFKRLLGHNPEILKSWTNLNDAFLTSGKLSPDLKEQVRRALAFGNRCEY